MTNERPLRVLVADDNPDSADSLAILMRMSGHEAQTAHDGEEAMRIAVSGWPDIAVLDIDMPVLSGYDIAKAVRAKAQRTALIALTGWTRDVERDKARAAGFDTFLTKPVDFDQLDSLLDGLKDRPRGEELRNAEPLAANG
ncbi:MAG TPA: response regulator [Steroidobacteraceae bacterium]|jgi:DNA-binding response OmpR family regulator|nr:response regulator [Steroidobacteraceae bacterium]